MDPSIEKTVEQMLQPFLDANGFELVGVEYVKEGGSYFLRIYVDKDGGIDIDECGRISEYASEKLDEHDPIPNAYFLEVSSPGAERPLKKPDDFEKAIGKHVLIVTREAVAGKREFEGKLIAYNEREITVATKKKTVAIAAGNIAEARLAVEI